MVKKLMKPADLDLNCFQNRVYNFENVMCLLGKNMFFVFQILSLQGTFLTFYFFYFCSLLAPTNEECK